MKKLLTSAAAVLALSGCKVGVQTDIFAADIMDALQGASDLTTPMTFSFEVAGTDGCDKARAGIMTPLSAAYGDAEFIGCNKQNFQTYAEFRVQTDVVLDPFGGEHPSNRPVFIGVHDLESIGRVGVAFRVNGTAMADFRAQVPDELTMFQPNRPDIRLSATFANDLREPIILQVRDVFADGHPIQGDQEYTLERREEVRIVLSDVTNAAIANGEPAAVIATFAAPTE